MKVCVNNLRLIHPILLLFLIAMGGIIPVRANGKKLKTGLPEKKVSVKTPTADDVPPGCWRLSAEDSILYDAARNAMIYLSGYDKTVSADVESFFVINKSSFHVAGFAGVMVYTSSSGEMYTSREINKRISIPPGETKLVTISSWDKQHSFRYIHSAPGRKNVLTYSVKFYPSHFWIKYDNK